MNRDLLLWGVTHLMLDTFNPSANHQLIVMTRHPDKYKNLEISGQIEFTNESPNELTARFKRKVMNKCW